MPDSFAFDMTDALMARAVREDCVAIGRELARPRDLAIVAASTILFAVVVDSGSHWAWWIAGLPIVLVGVILAAWGAAYLWLPSLAASRLAHLPHRHVKVEIADERLAFETATERLEVAWSELKSLKRRPSFWIVALKSGARIPLPVTALDGDALALLARKLG
jgi:hypothetical protein